MSLLGARAEFRTVDRDADKVYSDNRPDKGDSWKRVSIEELWDKLKEETGEVFGPKGLTMLSGELRKELLDVINVARMLAKRLEATTE